MFSFDRLYRTCEPKKSRNQRGLDFLCFCSSCDITDPPPPHTEQFIYILTGGVCACRPVCCSSCRLRVCGCFQPSCWILIELLRRQQTVSSDHRLNCRWTRSFKAAADSQIFYSFIQQMHRPSTFLFGTCLSSSSAREKKSTSLLLLVVASLSSRVTAQLHRLLLVIISLKLIIQQLLVSLFIQHTLTTETETHRFTFSPSSWVEPTQVGGGSALSRSVLQLLSNFQLVLVVLPGPLQVLQSQETTSLIMFMSRLHTELHDHPCVIQCFS